MRFYTLAWFYNAQDTLLHIRSLQYDPNTPHRVSNDLFGGTEINGFEYDLKLHAQNRIEDLSYTALMGEHVPFFCEYQHEIVQGSALIHMDINLHSTELWAYLTRGEPLSKIIVRIFEIQESGRLEPFVDYTFKECWLFDHTTRTDNYQIKFTYCCGEIHFHEGNRFAKHQRCVPFEPTESQISDARGRETMAQLNATKQQAAQETERIAIPRSNNESVPLIHRFDVNRSQEFNGKLVGAGGLDDFAFHIVENPQTTDDLVKFLFQHPTEATRANFMKMNPHLSNGLAYPAQMVLMTDQTKSDYLTHELGLVNQIKEVESLRKSIEGNPSDFAKMFVDNATLANFSTGMGFATTYFQAHQKELLKVLKEIEDGFSHTYRLSGGTLQSNDFAKFRFKKYQELDSLLNKSMKSKLYGGIAGAKNAQNLEAVRYATEFDWGVRKLKAIPSLSEFYANTVQFEKAIKASGYLAIGLGALDTHSKIKDACTADQETCTKSKYVMWTAFAGEIFASSLATTGATWVISTLIVAPLGLGGLVAVGMIAIPSIALGYYAGEKMKEYINVDGEVVYRSLEAYKHLGDRMLENVLQGEDNAKTIEIELLGE